jgi:uncharacterized peroxidase-related enzyme
MPYIPLNEQLPGITGLLEYRQDTALPGERELIATVVSYGNECKFCTAAHTAAADLLLGEKDTTFKAKTDPEQAPVSDKMKALLAIARAVQVNGRQVTVKMVAEARAQGATDLEIHDTVLIAALFSLYNRYVDGLASVTPAEPAFYDRLGHILVDKGYLPSQDRYKDLKCQAYSYFDANW